MAVCYFNNEYNKKYSCQYEIKKDGIEVEINYDISKELPEINGIKGVRAFGSDTEFEKRDILIIDYKTKMSYLLKDAYHYGHQMIFGTPDNASKTKFFSQFYFFDSDYEKLIKISKENIIKKIKIYSSLINEFIGFPSLCRKDSEEKHIIELKKKTEKQTVEVNENNVKSLTISDYWYSKGISKSNEINIELNGCIEIEVNECINYEEVYNYIKELLVYFQLLKPDKFYIDKIKVEIEGDYYGLGIPIEEIKHENTTVEKSVDDTLLNFLSKCYKLIPYRNSENTIRNIPYITLETSRNLEDNFLMFYRFIECYYKQQPLNDIKKTFLMYSIENNYKKKYGIEDKNIENLIQEIICLRNHYAHEGYYIKNNRLYISFPKINKKANPKNYRAEGVDFEWIYERTKILYDIAIDIIFRNMLNYNKYKFDKHF